MSNFRVKRMTDKYFMNKCIDMRLDKTIAVSWQVATRNNSNKTVFYLILQILVNLSLTYFTGG